MAHCSNYFQRWKGLQIIRRHSHCEQFMGRWRIFCKCQQCGLLFKHPQILGLSFRLLLSKPVQNVFCSKIHWINQALAQVFEIIKLSFIFLLLLIIVIGPTFVAFIFLPILIFISRLIILLLLIFSFPQILFLLSLRLLFIGLISDRQLLIFELQLVFIIKPQLVSQLAWLSQFVGCWLLIIILFWHFLRLIFIAQVQELILLPFIILLSTFIVKLLPFFLKAHVFFLIWLGLLLLLLFLQLQLLFLGWPRQPKILIPFFQLQAFELLPLVEVFLIPQLFFWKEFLPFIFLFQLKQFSIQAPRFVWSQLTFISLLIPIIRVILFAEPIIFLSNLKELCLMNWFQIQMRDPSRQFFICEPLLLLFAKPPP